MSHANPLALPVSPTRTGLRLLCVLCHKAGARIAQPVCVRRLPSPWAPLSARWPLALPSPFLLREARPKPPAAEVLARCVRQWQADAVCSSPRTLRAGGLNDAH